MFFFTNAKKMLKYSLKQKQKEDKKFKTASIKDPFKQEKRKIKKYIRDSARKGGTFTIVVYKNTGFYSQERASVNKLAEWLNSLGYETNIFESWSNIDLHISWKGE